MTTAWILAKYMEDPRLREPRNVGVMLFHGGKVYSKFRGEAEGGRIDGRVARGFVSSTENYKDWVKRWRYEAANVEGLEAFASMVKPDTTGNYFLERSGKVAHGNVSDPEAFLEKLYRDTIPSDLVREDRSRSLAMRAFEGAGILGKIEDDPSLDLDDDRLFFDYKYENGSSNFFRRLTLRNDKTSWRSVHDTTWAIGRVMEAKLLRPARVIALIELQDETAGDLLRPLRKVQAGFIDLGQEDASERLKVMISSAPVAI